MLPFLFMFLFLRYICVIMRVFTFSHFVECKSLNIHNSSLYERMWSASLTNNNPAAICHNCAKRIFRGRRTASSQASKNHDINLCKKGHERNSESMSSRYGGRSPETKRQNGFPFRAFSLFHNRFLRGHAPMAQTHTHSHRKNPNLVTRGQCLQTCRRASGSLTERTSDTHWGRTHAHVRFPAGDATGGARGTQEMRCHSTRTVSWRTAYCPTGGGPGSCPVSATRSTDSLASPPSYRFVRPFPFSQPLY